MTKFISFVKKKPKFKVNMEEMREVLESQSGFQEFLLEREMEIRKHI